VIIDDTERVEDRRTRGRYGSSQSSGILTCNGVGHASIAGTDPSREIVLSRAIEMQVNLDPDLR
jgi:hypothetical protein